MSTDLAASKVTVFSSARRSLGGRTDPTLRARVRELRTDLAEVLEISADALIPDDPHLEFTPEALAALASQCVERAQGHDTKEAVARELCFLALDLQQLELEIHQEDMVLRARRLNDCADGLDRLREVPSSRDLRNTVCHEMVERCGFGRVVLSRVDNGMWMPSNGDFGEGDASWFDEWIGQTIPLHGSSPEARLLTERRPALVYDTGAAEVHHDIIVESGQSSSYTVAPLMSRGNVVGFLHADYFPTTRTASEVDRDVLWAFAEGFTRIHERMVLMERVQAQRAQLGVALDSALRSIGASGDAVPAPSTLCPSSPDALAELTARETEVLQLMVEGATNRSIATRLVIAEDTVKSHVKQVLRKLGVTNRSQAIARAAGTAVA